MKGSVVHSAEHCPWFRVFSLPGKPNSLFFRRRIRWWRSLPSHPIAYVNKTACGFLLKENLTLTLVVACGVQALDEKDGTAINYLVLHVLLQQYFSMLLYLLVEF